MTAIAWAILMYAAVAFPEVKLPSPASGFMTIGFTVICILTIKDIFR